MRRWVWLLAAPLLVGCSQVDALQQVSGVPLATVEIAVDDVLVDQDVNVLTSPVCSEADGEFTCAGTTLDDKPITVTVPDDQTQVMTIKIDGTQIFSGPVQEVIEKAGERTS
jgi:hypothetical protein